MIPADVLIKLFTVAIATGLVNPPPTPNVLLIATLSALYLPTITFVPFPKATKYDPSAFAYTA